MASSRRRASIISCIASWAFFLIIILQVPLFRVPCRFGICESPVEVTASHLCAIGISFPLVVKHLLYPGAVAEALVNNNPIPSSNELLKLINFPHFAPEWSGFRHLEILVGSYLSLVGACLGLARPGRMSLFGSLLIIWGFIREPFLQKHANVVAVEDFATYPTMLITVTFAFLSIRKDIRKLLHSCKAKRVSKAKNI